MTKLLYLWLVPLGEVAYSHREMAEALSVERYQVSKALKRLKELGLLRELGGNGYKKLIVALKEPEKGLVTALKRKS
jgi:DNA-binding transcriptional regulator YhcF (GntR family)